jgi:hypothetical protein
MTDTFKEAQLHWLCSVECDAEGVCEWWVGEDSEGGGRGLFQGTITEFACRD